MIESSPALANPCVTLKRLAFCLFLVLLFGNPVRAQQTERTGEASQPRRNAASSASAGTTVLEFDSVLSRYKPMNDQKLGSWREANDSVTRIGGWRAYLKEAQQADPAAAPSPAPSAPASRPKPPNPPNSHGAHGAKL